MSSVIDTSGLAQRRLALLGNPNCGKTALFNRLTGTHQSVGNWPGVTVERRSGTFEQDGSVLEVVDPDHPTKLVPYGHLGRVRLTTLTKEFFIPRFLERDECEREAPCDQYPWDGVRNVRPFSKFQKSVVEGVY